MSLITPYLRQTVTLQRAGAVDRYGQPTFTTVTLPARVQNLMRLVRTTEGQQVTSDATLFLEPGTVVSPRDRVVFDGQAYQVLSVTRHQGLDAATHTIVYLGAG